MAEQNNKENKPSKEEKEEKEPKQPKNVKKTIDKTLRILWQKQPCKPKNIKNATYNSVFDAYCKNESYDDESLAIEFDINSENWMDSCTIGEAFENGFVFDDADAVTKILKTIRNALITSTQEPTTNPIIDPSYQFKPIKQYNFNIPKKEEEKIRALLQKLYADEKQCQELCQNFAEKALKNVICYQLYNKIPLLLNLVDTCTRTKFNNWVKESPKPDIQKMIKKLGNQEVQAELYSAIKSFQKRLYPEIQDQPTFEIKDSLNDYISYTKQAIEFIHNFLEIGTIKTPFQLDLWIIPNEVEIFSPEVDDDDDDDNNKKDEKKDGIGNIQDRLEKNKGIMYQKAEIKTRQTAVRSYGECFNSVKSMFEKEKKDADMRNCRVCCIIDKRGEKGKEPPKMHMYILPDEFSKIPKEHVPEVYIGLSTKCLLPQHNKLDLIGAKKGLNGRMFTISFHVESVDQMKAYLYINGQMGRFLPQDMKTLWPKWFDENMQANKTIDEKVDEIQLADKGFENFFKYLTNQDVKMNVDKD